MKWSSSLRIGSQSSPEVFGIENRFRLFLLVVACVALCHAVIVLFFNWDISFKNKSQLPDLEIELVSEAQVLGNADSTLVAKAHSGEKSKSKNSTQPVLSGRHSESSMAVNQEQSASSESSSVTINTPGVAQISGGVPTAGESHGPSLLNNVKPKYPLEAYRKRSQGTVILYVQVMDTGGVGSVKVGSSSGSDLLDESAIEAVKEWKFSPGKSGGKIVAQWIKVPITFNLKNR